MMVFSLVWDASDALFGVELNEGPVVLVNQDAKFFPHLPEEVLRQAVISQMSALFLSYARIRREIRG